MLTTIVAVSSVPFLCFEAFARYIAPRFLELSVVSSVASAAGAAGAAGAGGGAAGMCSGGGNGVNRLLAIDGVRLLASVHIVMFHLFQQVYHCTVCTVLHGAHTIRCDVPPLPTDPDRLQG
jgi:hypothetical protein